MKPSVARLSMLVLLMASPAWAQSPPAASEPAAGRYQFQPVEGGLARLDTATGEIILCRLDPARMTCDMEAAKPADGVAAAAPRSSSAAADDDAEFERALGRMKRVFRAFGDIARDFDRPVPRANPGPNRT